MKGQKLLVSLAVLQLCLIMSGIAVAQPKDLAFTATPLKVDQVADLALLRIQAPPPDLHPLSLGDLKELEVGQDVHAIGHPKGEAWTVYHGNYQSDPSRLPVENRRSAPPGHSDPNPNRLEPRQLRRAVAQ